MSVKHIRIRDVFESSSVITRQSARELFNIIQSTPESEIVLDFADVEYSSRSFFNELLSKELLFSALGKQIRFMNLPEALRELLEFSKCPMTLNTAYRAVASSEVVSI